MKNFVFKLSEPVELVVVGKGEKEIYHDIEFKAPFFDCIKSASKLQQAVSRGLRELSLSQDLSDEKAREIAEKSKKENTLKEKIDLVKIVLMTSNEDLSKTIEDFIELACQVGKFDDNLNLKKTHFRKLSYNDTIDMVFEYIANFLMPSFF